jgi:hypothetical protein
VSLKHRTASSVVNERSPISTPTSDSNLNLNLNMLEIENYVRPVQRVDLFNGPDTPHTRLCLGGSD